MNERIQELAEQAGLNLELQSIKVEKFAELIVKECADVARGWTDVYVVEDNAPRQIDEFIKKEFGVEE